MVLGDTGRGSEGRPNAGFVVTSEGVVVIDALASPAITVTTAEATAADQANARGAPGIYMAVPAAPDSNEDRPIGVSASSDSVAVYPERYVVVTREKLAGLAVGRAVSVFVPLSDADPARLGGDYGLYLRIERMP